MSYAGGDRQFPIRDFRRAIFDENPGGNGSNFRLDLRAEVARRKLFESDCTAYMYFKHAHRANKKPSDPCLCAQ